MSAVWPVYTPEELLRQRLSSRRPWHDEYLTMFSSLWGGFCTEPTLWGVPPDDHMVHRGDAVFESIKCVNGRVWCLDEHLDRLVSSAAGLELTLPPEFAQIKDLLRQALVLGGQPDFTARLSVSRGPGSFTVNPYDAKGSQLYLTTSKLHRPAPELYARGARLATSPFPARSELSAVKSCDYLLNALAKKAAIDAGADYVVSFDREGFLTEGATENVAVVTRGGELIAPSFARILKGVTLTRAMAKGQELVEEGLLQAVLNRDLTRAEVEAEAAEIFLTTTSFNVLGVSLWDGRPVGDGRPGPVTREILKRLELEINGEGPYVFPLR
jgi:branched-chain amino acid aminotransferase